MSLSIEEFKARLGRLAELQPRVFEPVTTAQLAEILAECSKGPSGSTQGLAEWMVITRLAVALAEERTKHNDT